MFAIRFNFDLITFRTNEKALVQFYSTRIDKLPEKYGGGGELLLFNAMAVAYPVRKRLKKSRGQTVRSTSSPSLFDLLSFELFFFNLFYLLVRFVAHAQPHGTCGKFATWL